MTFSRFFLSTSLLGFTLSSPAHALTYGEATAIVAKLPKQDLVANNHGRLCETLGVQVMQEKYPNAVIHNGIVYKKKNRVIGELDLVIEQDNVITDVIEVKCMVNYNQAAKKADEQNDRFSAYIGRCDIDFSLAGEKIPCALFGNPDVRFGKMSYTDARRAGFDHDLNFSRSEILRMIKEVNALKKNPKN